MSFWALVSALLLIFWWLHAQRLNKKHDLLTKELKSLKDSQGSLISTLKSRGKRLDVLFAEMNEVVMRVDRLGRVMAVNPHATEMFEMGSVLDLPQSMLVFYRDPEWHNAFSEALKILPEASSLPDIYVGKRVLAPRIAPLGKEQALLLCVDVTDKHRMETQRKTLFANLMHDLKTPLTSILGYARSIESFGDDPAVRHEAAQVIADESVRANEFLNALLTLDQVESFTPDISVSSDPQQVCQTVVHGFSSQLAANQVEIEWAGFDSIVRVQMAESDLHRIMDNLIENALRYTPKGSNILINGYGNESAFRLEVIDQGDGVPEKELPRLTERFYRGDMARSNSLEAGHGLGLAIVNELLMKYGGKLKLKNHERFGLSIIMELPLASH